MATVNSSEISSSLAAYISQMDHRLSDRSKREYTARMKEISKRIHPVGGAITPAAVLSQLTKLVTEQQVTASTFRSYKSATMFWLAQQAQALIASGASHSDYAQAFDELSQVRYARLAAGPQRGSTGKLKYFAPDCVEALRTYATTRGHRAPNAGRAFAFVTANLLVGLRPVEWFDCAFASRFMRDEQGNILRDGDGRIRFEPMLVINNAKNSHGRGNGPQREIVLHEIKPDELKALVYFRELALQFKGRHRSSIDAKTLTNLFYRPINNLIRRALLAAGFDSHSIPSIYSTRHQAVADCKASGLSRREIAAFFGHSSEYTHREHYGLKRHGGRLVTFRPSPECLARVSERGITRKPEVMPSELVANVDQWVTEHAARKNT